MKKTIDDPEVTTSSVSISSKKVAIYLAAITVLLVGMDAIRLFFKYEMPDLMRWNEFLDDMFQITDEHNAPSFFSSFVLVLASAWLILIARIETRFRIHWLILGLTFIFLALDESLLIHERVSRLTRETVSIEGNLSYGTWVIPYLVATACLGLFYWKFVFQLPQRTMWLFIISGAIYVGSAAGFELIEGFIFTNYGENTFYKVVHWAQEVVEILGIILFNFALIDYLSSKRIRVTFG